MLIFIRMVRKRRPLMQSISIYSRMNVIVYQSIREELKEEVFSKSIKELTVSGEKYIVNNLTKKVLEKIKNNFENDAVLQELKEKTPLPKNAEDYYTATIYLKIEEAYKKLPKQKNFKWF